MGGLVGDNVPKRRSCPSIILGPLAEVVQLYLYTRRMQLGLSPNLHLRDFHHAFCMGSKMIFRGFPECPSARPIHTQPP